MSSMTPERWKKIEAVFDQVVELAVGERSAFLDASCAGDAALRAAVEQMLVAHDDIDGGPLGVTGERAAAAWAAPLLARAHALTGETTDEGSRGEGAVSSTNDETMRMPERIGPWRLVSRAGAGGMGDVFVAERDDGAFRMRVALKLVRHGLHRQGSFIRRFSAERQILAQLNHPGIARLIDGGVTAEGVPWYAMEYVEGVPIDVWCDAHAPRLEQRLTLFARVCDALSVAHAKSVVHRDIKPSNIFVTTEGHPKLLDFGIAKALTPDGDLGAPERDEAESIAVTAATTSTATSSAEWRLAAAPGATGTGQRLLTPAYASPEQLTGGVISPATDVWALGVVLYRLLTGRHPFQRTTKHGESVERAVLEDAPTAPSAATGVSPKAWSRALRGDLDAILLRALSRDANARYADAAAFADDVRRHLTGRPVRARLNERGALWYRTTRLIRRHRVACGAAVFGVMAGVGSLVAWRGEGALRDELHPIRGAARHAGTQSLRAVGYYEDGMRAWGRGTWGEASRLLNKALEEDSTFALAALFAADAASREEDYVTARRELARARRLAESASTKVGLLVRTYVAFREQSPRLALMADSLTSYAPESAAGPYFAALAVQSQGAFIAAARKFAALTAAGDSTMPAMTDGVVAPCWSCAAIEREVYAWVLADSLTAAARVAERRVQRRPQDPMAWRALANVRLLQGGRDTTAFRRVMALDPAAADEGAEWLAIAALKQGEFAQAEALLRARLLGGVPGREDRALWALVAVLREQGRWSEALDAARRFRVLPSMDEVAGSVRPGSAPATAVLEAQVLLESGRAHEATALIDSIVRGTDGATLATYTTGTRAQLATALSMLGDTTRLEQLADSVELIASARGSITAQQDAAYIRGLLQLLRREHAAAVNTLSHAIGSPNLGFTRANLALAETLLRLDRPADAVAIVQPALRGTIEGGNTYTTEAEVHASLARAWRAAGNADSAAAHERWVSRARTKRPF